MPSTSELPTLTELESSDQFRSLPVERQLSVFDRWAEETRKVGIERGDLPEEGETEFDQFIANRRGLIEVRDQVENPDGTLADSFSRGVIRADAAIQRAIAPQRDDEAQATAGMLSRVRLKLRPGEAIVAGVPGDTIDLPEGARGRLLEGSYEAGVFAVPEGTPRSQSLAEFEQVQRGRIHADIEGRDAALEEAIQDQERIEALPPDKAVRAFTEAEGFKKPAAILAKNFVPIAAHTLAESATSIAAPVVMGSAGGAKFGPVGSAVGGASGGFMMEYALSYQDFLDESAKAKGIDIKTPEGLLVALQNPEIISEAKERATKRAIPIAAFDALTLGIGSKLAEKFGTRLVVNLAIDPAGGAAGELAAQKLSGQAIDFKDATLEAIGQAGTGIAATAKDAATTGLEKVAESRAPEQPEQPVVDRETPVRETQPDLSPTDETQDLDDDAIPFDPEQPSSNVANDPGVSENLPSEQEVSIVSAVPETDKGSEDNRSEVVPVEGTSGATLRGNEAESAKVVSEPKRVTTDEAPRYRSEAIFPEAPADSIFEAPVARPTRLQVEETPETEPISAPKVIDAISATMKAVGSDAPTRTGNLTTRQSLGEFDMLAEVSRIRTANNIPTAAHEAAHGIEKAVYGFPHQWKSVVSSEAHRELNRLGKALYGNTRPAGGYDSEGFAEFLRIRITQGRDRAAKEAPKFTEFFEGTILAQNPKLGPAIEKAAEAARRWEEQGSINRAKQGIAKPESIGDKLKRAPQVVDLVQRQLVEMAKPVRDLVETAERKRGAPIAVGEDPYQTLKARRMTHDAVAEHWAEKGMTDFAGNVVGKSLREALAPVKNRMEDFLIYLWAKRSEAMAADGKDRNSGLSPEDTQEIIDRLKSPEFELAAQGLYDFNEGVLNYVAQASPDFARVVSRIRMGDPGAYIPLQREFNALEKRSRLPGGMGQSPFQRLRGSGRRIKNPIESILSQASAMIAKAHEKRVLDQMIRLATSVEGMGHLVIEVPKTQVPVAERSLEEMIEEVRRRVEAQGGGVDVDPGQADLASEVLTFFAPAHQPKANEDPILPVYRGGKVRWYQMDRDLYRSLSSMDVYRLPKALDLFLGVPARMFRLGTTGLRASFSLVTNPSRDLRVMFLNSQANANAPELFFTWIKTLGEVALDTASAGRISNEWIDAFERLGGPMAQQLRQDTRHTKRAARRLFQGRVVRTLDARNLFDFLREVLQFPESASRISELKLVAKDLGWKPGQPMTEEQATQLLLAAKEVTTDFSAGGDLSRVLNQSVPFFNASIQGPRAHIRALRKNPRKFLIRGLMGTALALGLWARNKDEEWWEELPAQERYLFTWIPFETPEGRKELLRIPRAFEADGVFAAMAEMFADAWYRQDPEKASEWFEAFVRTSLPGTDIPGSPVPVPLPVLAEEAIEQAANRDFFFDRPVVPEGELRLPEAEQFSPYTTRVSIKLGEMFDVSPRRVDHGIRGLFGGTGIDLVGMLGRGERGAETTAREKELADLPVIGVLFQYGGQSSSTSKSVTELYDRLEHAEKIAHSRRREETAEEREMRLQLTDAARAVTVLGMAMRGTASVEDRRKLQRMRRQIAREATEAHDANEVMREEFRRWKKEAEALSE